MKKRTAYFLVPILVFAVIFITLKTEQGIKFIWKVAYGKERTWSGIVVRLTGDEYFVPQPSGQSFLYIGDTAAHALISLKKENETANGRSVLIEQNCKIAQCSHIETRHFKVEGVPVTVFAYLERISDNEVVLEHAYLIDGADVWVKYTGDQTRFPVHRRTIDGIVAEIARKVKLGSGSG